MDQTIPPPLATELPPGMAWRDLDSRLHAVQARFTLSMSPSSLFLAYTDWAVHMANAPFRSMELADLALRQYARLAQAATGHTVIAPAPHDHRFISPAWQQAPYTLVVQAFLLAEEWCAKASDAGPGVSRHNADLVAFTNRQILDAFSPSNHPLLNPEITKATLESGGANWQAGLRTLLADQQAALTHKPVSTGLVVGRDIAATPGRVVFRNALMELIQYAPATAAVHPEPVLIVPAWIMKYYILDLSPQNSLIRYLVGQGHTVFAISWRNPGAEQKDLAFDDYRTLGPLAALQAIAAIVPKTRVHAAGYCLGGTLLAITAAALARDGDNRLASLSLFAAQTDFTEAGELQLFISNDQLAFLDDVMAAQGYLDSSQMAGAFQMLRSNDLVWSRLVKSYFLGEHDKPNDLMAWNADTTRMPARMHAEYLRRLFLNNDLAEGRFAVAGAPVSLADIHVPIFAVGTDADHVAPWRSVHKIHLLNGGDITFVLTTGGHNAGIVSEPGHKHRSYQLARRPAGGLYTGPDAFLATAPRSDGSWWPAWCAFLASQSGAEVLPPHIDAPSLGAAPGGYVLER